MSKEKAYIKTNTGMFVKSVSRSKGSYGLTADKTEAKGYSNLDALYDDIDVCMMISARRNHGLVFYYD